MALILLAPNLTPQRSSMPCSGTRRCSHTACRPPHRRSRRRPRRRTPSRGAMGPWSMPLGSPAPDSSSETAQVRYHPNHVSGARVRSVLRFSILT
jgi:hypothetical protein